MIAGIVTMASVIVGALALVVPGVLGALGLVWAVHRRRRSSGRVSKAAHTGDETAGAE